MVLVAADNTALNQGGSLYLDSVATTSLSLVNITRSSVDGCYTPGKCGGGCVAIVTTSTSTVGGASISASLTDVRMTECVSTTGAGGVLYVELEAGVDVAITTPEAMVGSAPMAGGGGMYINYVGLYGRDGVVTVNGDTGSGAGVHFAGSSALYGPLLATDPASMHFASTETGSVLTAASPWYTVDDFHNAAVIVYKGA